MKITKARLKQIIKEELQSEVIGLAFAAQAKKKLDKKKKQEKEGSYGGDGQMADSQLNTIVNLATKLDMIISDDTKIPNWVKSKITKSLDYISTSLNYLIGEIADAQEETQEETQEEMMQEKKLTKSQQEERDQLAKTIKKSTKPQYGNKEGTDAAFGIATNIVKSRAKKRKQKRKKIKEQGI